MAPPLISLRHATVRLGAEPLFAALTVAVAAADRICLVGRNGAGKSTLLRALAGTLELDAGERVQRPRTTVAYLPQEPQLPPALPALEWAQGGLPASFEAAAGRHRAAAILERLGIEPERRIADLSGGEARRVDLARTMVGEPDLLLLDEPTNHLDLPTIEHLEEDLAAWRGGLVLVSHDRAFLNAVSRTTWWLDRGRLRVLDQGFAAFDAWSEQILAAEEAELRRLSKSIAAETEWSHHGITARRRRNQGRLRRLQALRAERARRIAPPGRVKLGAATDPQGGQLVIEAHELTKRFDGRTLIAGFSTRIMRGDRVGIIGPSGCGKTTLLRLLSARLAPDAGTVRLGANLSISHVDQRREALDPDATPWELLCPGGGDQVLVRGRWQHVVGYLHDFLFRPEQARTPIRTLSGGERNRLLLARQLARPASLLVLDEPTNDLDIDTLDLLQETLGEFAGTLLLVSHDRDFLDRLVSSVIAFEGGGRLTEYAGGYSDLARQRGQIAAPAAKPQPAVGAQARARPQRADGRAQRDLDRLLERIGAIGAAIERLEAELADRDLFRRDRQAFEALIEQLARSRSELETAEERWLELAQRLERTAS
jgi:ATP-binding cassette subfamily F protein uup